MAAAAALLVGGPGSSALLVRRRHGSGARWLGCSPACWKASLPRQRLLLLRGGRRLHAVVASVLCSGLAWQYGAPQDYRSPKDYTSPAIYAAPYQYGRTSPAAYADRGSSSGGGAALAERRVDPLGEAPDQGRPDHHVWTGEVNLDDSGGGNGISGRGGGGGGGGDGWGDSSSGDGRSGKKSAAQDAAQALTALYAAIMAAGGITVWMREGSLTWLSLALAVSAILLYSAANFPLNPLLASQLALGASGTVLGAVGSVFIKTGRAYPAGWLAGIALLITVAYAQLLFTLS